MVSIILVTFNLYEQNTKACIESLLAFTPSGEYELIIVDNASTDSTVNSLKELESSHLHVKVIYNKENKGYAKGNNDGLRIAQGDTIVLLNNDTLVTPFWMSPLISLLNTHAELGMVGPVSNNVGNEQMVSIDDLTRDNYLQTIAPYIERNKGHWFKTLRLGFFCVMIPSKVFKQVGFLDERFNLGFFEDDDYCLRVRMLGFELAVAEDCFIYHQGGSSFDQWPKSTCNELFENNKALFCKKHNIEWTYSDVLLCYAIKFERDLFEYCNSVPCDHRVERICVRIRRFRDLITHSRASEISKSEKTGRSLELFSVRNRWSNRLTVFIDEFVFGSIRDKKHYVAAILRKLLDL